MWRRGAGELRTLAWVGGCGESGIVEAVGDVPGVGSAVLGMPLWVGGRGQLNWGRRSGLGRLGIPVW